MYGFVRWLYLTFCSPFSCVSAFLRIGTNNAIWYDITRCINSSHLFNVVIRNSTKWSLSSLAISKALISLPFSVGRSICCFVMFFEFFLLQRQCHTSECIFSFCRGYIFAHTSPRYSFFSAPISCSILITSVPHLNDYSSSEKSETPKAFLLFGLLIFTNILISSSSLKYVLHSLSSEFLFVSLWVL